MLSKSEFVLNLVMLKVAYKLNILPIKINVESGKIYQVSVKRQIIWRLLMALHCFRVLYILITFLQVIFIPGLFVLRHFSLHLVYLSGALLSVYMYYRLFLLQPQITRIVFNSLFGANEKSLLHLSEKTNSRPILGHSLQELLARFFPLMLSSGAIIVTIAFWLEPNMEFLLYSSYFGYTFNGIQVLFLLFEFFSIVVCLGSIYFWLELSLLFFDKTSSSLKPLLIVRKSATNCIDSEFTLLRNIIFSVRLFNQLNAPVVFAVKLACICLVTFASYFAMMYFSLNYLVGTFNYMIAFDSLLVFCIVFGHAFSIPQNIFVCKNQILVKLKMSKKSTRERRMFERMIWSLPNSGIQVGNFQTLQRISTPEFVDFVARNTATLLIMHK